jgi:ketosteroid isomerase-like protein
MDAHKFASSWIDSWNSHDLEDILSQYSDDIEIATPMIKLATGENGFINWKRSG